jgi:hypothetical protein
MMTDTLRLADHRPAPRAFDSGASPVALRAPSDAPESVFFPVDIQLSYSRLLSKEIVARGMKLDELIRSVGAARNEMVGLESLSDEDLDSLQDEFTRLRELAERKLHRIQEHRNRRRKPARHQEEQRADDH